MLCLGRAGIQSAHLPLTSQSSNMSYFLSLTGSPIKFSKSGFLLRGIGSILEQRSIDFRAVHAADLPPNDSATRRIAKQFVTDANELIEHASAIVLITPATKESSPALLSALLESLPDNAFARKPILLFATGGLPGHVAVLERALKETLFRLGTKTIAARVHIGTGGWIIVNDDRPRLSRGTEREIAHAIDLILQVVNPGEAKERSLELAR
jgi:NAD(P)H-dependent FMN reductase